MAQTIKRELVGGVWRTIVEEETTGGGGGSQDIAAVLAQGNDAGGDRIVGLADPVDAQDADTKAARDAAISALIDAAPGTLNTLNELAAALGDDASFAATVTTALAGKQPVDSDLTAIAALSTTSFGRNLLALADQAALLSAAGAAAAVHVHAGEDVTSGTVADARIASTIARDSEVTAAIAALSTVYQPLDGDLSAVASLTTTSYGRALLTLANLAALYSTLGVDADDSLATDSDTKIATQKAVKAYVDVSVSARVPRATANTCGYMSWGSVVIPDATFGYAAVPGSVDMADIQAVGTIQRTLVYNSFLQIVSIAGASGTDAEADPLSDAGASVLRKEFWDAYASANYGPGWFYMKEGGVAIVDGFGARILTLDQKEAQSLSFQGARATARRLGLDASSAGFFADTWNDDLVGTGGIASEADGVASANDWEERFVKPFSREVFGALRAAGVYICINGGGSKSGYHAEGSVDRGDSRLRWMETMAPFVDAFSHEYAFERSNDDVMDDSIRVTGVAANSAGSWWSYHLRIPALAFTLGKGYFGVVTGTAQNLRFSRASLLMVWDGIHEAAIYDFRGAGLTDTSPSWRYETGYPIAPHKLTGLDSYTRSRQYQLGTIVINPDPTTAHDAGDAGTTSVPAGDSVWFPGEWF